MEIKRQKVKNHRDFNMEYKMDKAVYLGGGAFGKVYKIQSEFDKKYWAVKIIECPTFQHFQLAQGEYQFCKQIDAHPSIITVKEIFEWHKNPFYYVAIIMEIGQRNMQQEIEGRKGQKAPFPQQELNQIFKDSLDGFYFIAQKSIYHRDIKPENILYNPNEKKVKITDFGLSKQFNEQKMKFSLGGQHSLMGTPIYLSPILWEAYVKKQNFKVTHNLEKSDVFSLGLTFLQLSQLLSIQELNQCNQEQKYVQKLINSVPDPQNKKMISKMLEFDEKKRADYKSILQEFFPQVLGINDIKVQIKQNDTKDYICHQHLNEKGTHICLEKGCYKTLCQNCVITHEHSQNLMSCNYIINRLINQNSKLQNIEFLKNTLDNQMIQKAQKNHTLSENVFKQTCKDIKNSINKYLDTLENEYLTKQKQKFNTINQDIKFLSKQLEDELQNQQKMLKKFKDSKNKSFDIANILRDQDSYESIKQPQIQEKFDKISNGCKSNQKLKDFAQNQKNQVETINNNFRKEIDQILQKMSSQDILHKKENIPQLKINQQDKYYQQQFINPQQQQQQPQQPQQQQQQQQQLFLNEENLLTLKNTITTPNLLNHINTFKDDTVFMQDQNLMLTLKKKNQEQELQTKTNSQIHCSIELRDYNILVTGSADFLLRIYSLDNLQNQLIMAEHQKAIYTLEQIKPNQFASAGWDIKINIFQKDPQHPFRFQRLLVINQHTSLISGIAFLPSLNSTISVGYDKQLVLTNLSANIPANQNTIVLQNSHKHWIRSLQKLRDNKFSTGDDIGLVKIWQIENVNQNNIITKKINLISSFDYIHDNRVLYMQYHQESDTLFTADQKSNICCLNYQISQVIFKIDINQNENIKFNLDYFFLHNHNEIMIVQCNKIKRFEISENLNKKYLSDKNLKQVKQEENQNNGNQIKNNNKKQKKGGKCACY